MLSFTYFLYYFGFMQLSKASKRKKKKKRKKIQLGEWKGRKPKRKDLFSLKSAVSKVCALA